MLLSLRAGVRTVRPSSGKATSRRFLSKDTKVNGLYRAGYQGVKCPQVPETCVRSPCVCVSESGSSILDKHHAKDWNDPETVMQATKDHVLMTWGASDPMVAGALNIVKGDGSYFETADGKRYLDFNSQAMCLNLGHTPHPKIVEAVKTQLETLAYAYPGTSTNPTRAKLSALLADIVPGDINTFMFPSSGSEANEAAIRIARKYTGRHKIFARYRSYHGATLGSIGLTGDFRRWGAEPGAAGIVHCFDPYPYSFNWGETEEEVCQKSLTCLREQLWCEGPQNVAAIFLESITGTNGILVPPKGYLEGVREMCDKYGIMMVCDEVMAGFGRTGKMFGFCHAPGVVPDMVSFAKGINGGFISMGGLGLRDHLAHHFKTSPVGYGSTYNGHPVGMASAHAALQVFLEEGVLQNVQKLEPIMQECYQDLAHKHDCVKQARTVGLFGCFDMQRNRQGDFSSINFAQPRPMLMALKKELYERGLFTMMRGHNVFTNPPLNISESDLRKGFAILDDAFGVIDKLVTETD